MRLHDAGRGERQGARGKGRDLLAHALALLALGALAIVWTWPLAANFRDHIPGAGGDNYSFLWNLWWMRKALSTPDLTFFQSAYLFHPFGVDLVNHPHTALQGYLSATVLGGLTVIEAENLYIIVSVFLNAACAYALVFDIVRNRRLALLAGVMCGGSPYVAAHLMGHFDLLTAWVMPLFVLFLRRALHSGRVAAAVGCGACVAVAAYSAYYHVVYLVMLALAYTGASCIDGKVSREARPRTSALFTTRLAIVGLLTLDLFLMLVIATSGGTSIEIAGIPISVREVRNPMLAMWLLALGWVLATFRVRVRVHWRSAEAVWRGVQAMAITTATFAVLCLPLVVQAFGLVASGRYVSQTYFWRSAPRGVDVLAPLLGNPFHPLYGGAVSGLYESLGLDRIEAVGWIGIVPIAVLLVRRGSWLDREEARRWTLVSAVFAVWALGPFMTLAGFEMGLPLPQSLARFVPLVENARMPGRAMVGVYLGLAVLMAQRLASMSTRSATTTAAAAYGLIALLAFDYFHAPIPLTALDRPAVYEQLASIQDEGAVVEVPFGIGDGLTPGQGSQERRLLYHATIHGHPVVGGYIGRMPPRIAQAYNVMPVVGNLLRLSSGGEAVVEEPDLPLAFRYLVLDTVAASPELVEYVHTTLDMDLIASGGGRQLYAVQGVRASRLRAALTP